MAQDYTLYSAPVNLSTIGDQQVSHLSIGVIASKCKCNGLIYTSDIKTTGINVGLSKINILHVPIGIGLRLNDFVFNAYVGIAFLSRTSIEYGVRLIHTKQIRGGFYTFLGIDISNTSVLPVQKSANFGFAWRWNR